MSVFANGLLMVYLSQVVPLIK